MVGIYSNNLEKSTSVEDIPTWWERCLQWARSQGKWQEKMRVWHWQRDCLMEPARHTRTHNLTSVSVSRCYSALTLSQIHSSMAASVRRTYAHCLNRLPISFFFMWTPRSERFWAKRVESSMMDSAQLRFWMVNGHWIGHSISWRNYSDLALSALSCPMIPNAYKEWQVLLLPYYF